MHAGQAGGIGLLVLAACSGSGSAPDAGADAGDDADPCADHDGDGQRPIACGGLDCDDTDPERHAGAIDEIDTHDQSCDGVDGYDEDGDGIAAGAGDCDDGHADVSPAGADVWDTEIVDADGFDVGSFPSLVVGPDGSLSASYLIGDTFTARTALRGDGGWTTTTLPTPDECGDVFYLQQGFGLSSAWAADGARHVFFLGFYQAELRHATDASGAWEIETVAPTVPCEAACDCSSLLEGPDTSVALDRSGVLHVAFPVSVEGDPSHLQLQVATGTFGDWSVEAVTPERDDAGLSSDIGVAPDGRVWVAYLNETRGGPLEEPVSGVWVSERGAGGWDATAIDTESDAGYDVELAFAPDGTPHLAYHDRRRRSLRHAWRDAGGAWRQEPIDQEGGAGRRVSLAVDAGGVVHVTYFAEDAGELRYATNVGGEWSRQAIGTGGPFSALALDAGGVPQVLLYDGARALFTRPRLDGIDGDCNGVDW